MSTFTGRVVVAGEQHVVAVCVGVLGNVSVEADGKEAFSQTASITTQEFSFTLLGSPAKLRLGAGNKSSYSTCEMEVCGEVTRLLRIGESSFPSAPQSLLRTFGFVFVGVNSVMIWLREPAPGREVWSWLFHAAFIGLGLLLLTIDRARQRRKR